MPSPECTARAVAQSFQVGDTAWLKPARAGDRRPSPPASLPKRVASFAALADCFHVQLTAALHAALSQPIGCPCKDGVCVCVMLVFEILLQMHLHRHSTIVRLQVLGMLCTGLTIQIPWFRFAAPLYLLTGVSETSSVGPPVSTLAADAFPAL